MEIYVIRRLLTLLTKYTGTYLLFKIRYAREIHILYNICVQHIHSMERHKYNIRIIELSKVIIYLHNAQVNYTL